MTIRLSAFNIKGLSIIQSSSVSKLENSNENDHYRKRAKANPTFTKPKTRRFPGRRCHVTVVKQIFERFNFR